MKREIFFHIIVAYDGKLCMCSYLTYKLLNMINILCLSEINLEGCHFTMYLMHCFSL